MGDDAGTAASANNEGGPIDVVAPAAGLYGECSRFDRGLHREHLGKKWERN